MLGMVWPGASSRLFSAHSELSTRFQSVYDAVLARVITCCLAAGWAHLLVQGCMRLEFPGKPFQWLEIALGY